MNKTPIETLLDAVDWQPTGDNEVEGDGLPVATHSGIWHFMGQDIRVYRLNTGKAIIHADDMHRILGIPD
jgi:hypothetical protein